MTDRDDACARHAEEQQRRWLLLTPEERLEWLTRAIRFVHVALAPQHSASGEVVGLLSLTSA